MPSLVYHNHQQSFGQYEDLAVSLSDSYMDIIRSASRKQIVTLPLTKVCKEWRFWRVDMSASVEMVCGRQWWRGDGGREGGAWGSDRAKGETHESSEAQ